MDFNSYFEIIVFINDSCKNNRFKADLLIQNFRLKLDCHSLTDDRKLSICTTDSSAMNESFVKTFVHAYLSNLSACVFWNCSLGRLAKIYDICPVLESFSMNG